MPTLPRSERIVLKPDEWPEAHRALWEAGLVVGDPLDGPFYAATLSPATLSNARKGWGAWLHVLISKGRLDLDALPAQTVTPANVRLFDEALLARANVPNTINTRHYDLRSALRIMQPEYHERFSWLTAPGDVSLRRQMDITPKPKDVPHSADIVAWGRTLLETASQCDREQDRLTQYRNGVVVLILAVLAMRNRSIASLRIGQHVVKKQEGYRLILAACDIKTKDDKADYLLPDALVPCFEHYLHLVRPQLLGTSTHTWLWVNADGTPHQLRGIEGMFRKASKLHFGKTYGTHICRTALATTLAEDLPDHAGLASRILNISPQTEEGYYNKAKTPSAAKAFGDHIAKDRQRYDPHAVSDRAPKARKTTRVISRSHRKEGGTT